MVIKSEIENPKFMVVMVVMVVMLSGCHSCWVVS